jgi:hypothetical protein
LGGAFVFQKLGNLELVYAAMPGGLPFVTNEKTAVRAIKDQCPPIFIPRRRATGAPVELSLDNGHARSLACFSIKHMGMGRLTLQPDQERPISN